MQVIVVSNSPSKRAEYFVEAGRNLQAEVRFLTYEELFNCLSSLRQAVVKLEPWVSSETDFLRYALLSEEYKETLQRLGKIILPDDVHFLNPPHALLQALDKKETKQILSANDLSVTPMLDTPRSFEELVQALSDYGRGCFLKPRYGSGAGGIMAIRYQPRQKKWVVYTTLQKVDGIILHLNNNARLWSELPLSEDVRQRVYLLCRKAVRTLGLRYAGVDVLIERGTDTPYIIEVNGQGDHIYQDMYAHNSIYTRQIRTIKKKYDHADR